MWNRIKRTAYYLLSCRDNSRLFTLSSPLWPCKVIEMSMSISFEYVSIPLLSASIEELNAHILGILLKSNASHRMSHRTHSFVKTNLNANKPGRRCMSALSTSKNCLAESEFSAHAITFWIDPLIPIRSSLERTPPPPLPLVL